jgi:general secretion pathway protein D
MNALRMLTRISGILLLAAWTGLSAHATVLSVSPAYTNVTAGQTFSVDVQIFGVTDLYAFQFDLGFDPTVLSVTSVTEGAFLQGGGPTLWIDPTIDNVAGTVTYVADALNGAVTGVGGYGILATISFAALTAGSSNISLYNGILLDSQLFDTAIDQISNGRVVVTQVPEPSALVLLVAGLGAMVGFGKRRAHAVPRAC